MHARLRQFVNAMTALVDTGADEARIIREGGALLRALVSQDGWLPADCAQPDPRYYRQYLLYLDPAKRFSVLSFVWGPGQSTPVHNHTVWGLIGMLRGAELNQAFQPGAEGRLERAGAVQRLEQGMVTAVSPALGDIHQVSNAFDDRVSVGIHVYGADIGALERAVFMADGEVKPFRSGYANV